MLRRRPEPVVHPPPNPVTESGMAPATPDIGRRSAWHSQAAAVGGSSCCAVLVPVAAPVPIDSDDVSSVASSLMEQSQFASGEADCAAGVQASNASPNESGSSDDKIDENIASQEGSATNATSASAAAPICTPDKLESTPRRPKKRSTKGVTRFKVMKDKKVTPKATPKAVAPRDAQKKRKTMGDVCEPVGASSHKPVRRKLSFESSENITASFRRANLIDDLKCLAKTWNCPDDPSAGMKAKKGKAKKAAKHQKSGESALVPYQRALPDVSSSTAMVLYRDYTQLAVVLHGNCKKKLHTMVSDLDDKTLQVYEVLRKWDETDSESFEGVDIGSGPEWHGIRQYFEHRVDAFIATMNDLFGHREYFEWGGSVIDSVIGTFLTQNVSDNLSSNAFMNLASKFPPTKRCSDNEECSIVSPSINVGEEHLNSYEAFEVTDSVNSVSTKHDPENDSDEEDIKGQYGQEYNAFVESFIEHVKRENFSTLDIDRIIKLMNDKFGKPVLSKSSLKKFIYSLKPEDTSRWDKLREEAFNNGYIKRNEPGSSDSVDWEAVQHAPIGDVANCIAVRGQHNLMACRIQVFLNRVKKDHKSFDLDWLRHVSRENAKNYLLSVHGLGDKSVDCIRLLSLKHKAFPVDVNVARIVTRLGWVKLQPLPNSAEFHLVHLYPIMRDVQKYLWPRLCTIKKEKLRKLHCSMITFGKVICTKRNPNCRACPFSGECKYYNSSINRAALPPTEKHEHEGGKDQTGMVNSARLLLLDSSCTSSSHQIQMCQHQVEINTTTEPIIEMPPSPEPEYENGEADQQELFLDDPCDIEDIVPGVSYDGEIDLCSNKHSVHSGSWTPTSGKDIVFVNPQSASCQNRKLKNIGRLRTLHTAYVLQDNHPILQEFEERVPGDQCPYLLVNCCYDDYTVKGTILIPCRTANRGNFPLDGTYFQVHEVFADHSSSHSPVTASRESIYFLPTCTVYFGSSIHSITQEQTIQDIQDCYKRGYICVRGYDRHDRKPKKLCAALHATTEKKGSGENGRKKTKTSQQGKNDEKASSAT